MELDSQALRIVVTIAATWIGISFLARGVRADARPEGKAKVVEYNRRMKVFALLLWVFPAVIGIAASHASQRDRLLAFGVTSGFFLLVLWLHLEFFHVTIRYDADGLHTASPWRRSRFIPWSAITGVRYSYLAGWYVLSTSGLGRVRLHPSLSGLPSLLEEFRSRGISVPFVYGHP